MTVPCNRRLDRTYPIVMLFDRYSIDDPTNMRRAVHDRAGFARRRAEMTALLGHLNEAVSAGIVRWRGSRGAIPAGRS